MSGQQCKSIQVSKSTRQFGHIDLSRLKTPLAHAEGSIVQPQFNTSLPLKANFLCTASLERDLQVGLAIAKRNTPAVPHHSTSTKQVLTDPRQNGRSLADGTSGHLCHPQSLSGCKTGSISATAPDKPTAYSPDTSTKGCSVPANPL